MSSPSEINFKIFYMEITRDTILQPVNLCEVRSGFMWIPIVCADTAVYIFLQNRSLLNFSIQIPN